MGWSDLFSLMVLATLFGGAWLVDILEADNRARRYSGAAWRRS